MSVVLTIATDLNMNAVKPDVFTVLQSGNCCTASGVQCDSNSHVTDINWSGMGLNGTLNTANIELLYSYLQSFNVSNNNLTGFISSRFASNVAILDLSSNALNGSINDIRLRRLETLNLANNHFKGTFLAILPVVAYFNISNNQLNGTLPYMPFISRLDASYNSISGNLLLNSPSTVNIMHNFISNVTFSSSSNLTDCNLQQNNLTGNNFPAICLVDVNTLSVLTTRNASSIFAKTLTNSSFLSTFSESMFILNSRRLANILPVKSSVIVRFTSYPTITKQHEFKHTSTTDSDLFKANLTIINLSFLYILRMTIHFIIFLAIAIRLFKYLSTRHIKSAKKHSDSENPF